MTEPTSQELIAEARRLEEDYGDSYEVMLHMSALADALESAHRTTAEQAAVIEAVIGLAEVVKSPEDAKPALVTIVNVLSRVPADVLSAHDERVRAEQREVDAQIAGSARERETSLHMLPFDQVPSFIQWAVRGAERAERDIRAAAAIRGEGAK